MAANDEDQGQVADSLKGDHEAFAVLISDHQRMIHSLCFRMTGSLADADDLAQETFIQAYTNLGAFRAESRFATWLYRIAVNHCLNWQKRNQRREKLLREWSAQEQDQRGSEDPRIQEVQAALMALDPKQRAAMVLTACEGFSHAEAAAALGCAETTVSWRLFAARRKLKRLLSAKPKSPLEI